MKRILSLEAAALTLCLPAAQPAPAGYVLELKGTWVSSRAGVLKRFDTLYPGEKVSASSATAEGDLVTISSFYHLVPSTTLTFTTTAPPPLFIRAGSKQDGWFVRVFAAIKNLGHTEQSQTLYAISRGSGMGPEEAVLEAAGGRPDLAPALTPVMPGEYGFQLTPLSKAGADRIKGTLSWAPPEAELVEPVQLIPGLYRLRLTDGSGHSVGAEAVVLIKSSQDLAPYRTAWVRFLATLSRGGKQDGPASEDLRTLRAGCLVALEHDATLLEAKP
jgi:hypothetical protein